MTLESVTICCFRDSIKINGIYVPLGNEIVEEYERLCYDFKRPVSHSYCPVCYKREVAKIDEYIFLEKSKEYLEG